jgi:ParB-like chromosome segregation protein Spo0J
MANISGSIAAEPLELALDQIGERFGSLRIVNPEADLGILRSLARYGQMTPVIVGEFAPNSYELLDGFKRLRGARSLSMPKLMARKLRLTLRAGKAALIQLNWAGKSINSMEEALVVHSLFREDGLSQVEIAALLGRHKSWVCRRISLIDRLCDEAQERIRLGLLPVSMGRELVRLPRGNQGPLLEAIQTHRLGRRELQRLIAQLDAAPPHAHAAILRDARKPIGPQAGVDTTADSHLCPLARAIHRKLMILEHSCLTASFAVQTTEFGQFEEDEEKLLLSCCIRVAATLERTGSELRQASGDAREARQ